MSNNVTLVGNLTRDPELRYTPSGAPVVKFGLAVNRSYTNRAGERVEHTDFFNVTAWRTLAENIAESCKTGIRVVVSGRITSRSWETEEGQKRTAVEIDADEVGPSLRWATADVKKVTRGGPGEWNTSVSVESSDADESAAPAAQEEEVHAGS